MLFLSVRPSRVVRAGSSPSVLGGRNRKIQYLEEISDVNTFILQHFGCLGFLLIFYVFRGSEQTGRELNV